MYVLMFHRNLGHKTNNGDFGPVSTFSGEYRLNDIVVVYIDR